MNSRPMAVAGHFYPDSCEEVLEWFKRWRSTPVPMQNFQPKAIIVPHAGYMYSGACAFKAYAQVTTEIKNVIVFGPSHRVAFRGASIGLFEKVQTPCGAIACDSKLNKGLVVEFPWLQYIPKAHAEHSTEVQFPFIKECFKNALITEIVYGSIDPKLLTDIMKICVNLPQTLLIISTDLSHFYTLEEANKLDNACINALKSLHVSELENCEACGMRGIEAGILLANALGWRSQVLDYCTSFDKTGDKSQVVGYMSAILG